MANKTKGTPQKEEAWEKGPATPDAPLPLLDLSDAAVTKMIKQATKRGYVTHEQLNAVIPSEAVTSEQIEHILAALNEMGINVVETGEAEADEEEAGEKPESEETEFGRTGRGHAEDAGQIRGQGADRAHRRPGAHVSSRNGLNWAALAPRRGRHRQAY
jgi:hypothetical protein